MELILAEDILAKQQKHQRTVRRATRILYGVFLLAFAAVVTALFFFAQIEPPFGTAPATAIFPLLLACYLIMLSATLVTIAIHEFGHLVAAWMVNYYVALILIGPFALARTNTGWRWRVGTNGSSAVPCWQGRSMPTICAAAISGSLPADHWPVGSGTSCSLFSLGHSNNHQGCIGPG